MKLGMVKVYKNWKKLKTIVSYQTPKKLAFFQYVILNAITNYPNKEKTLADILQNELQIFNFKIYAECLKDLIEKENIIEINKQTSLNYLANSYAEQDWIDRPIEIFYISKEALTALEQGYLLSKNSNREAVINFDFNIFSGEKYINNEQLSLLEKNSNDLIIVLEQEPIINGEDLFHLLEKYKLNINKNNIFNADTTFTSIRTNKKQEIYYNINQINNLLIDAYEEKEVILSLTTFKDIKIQIINDHQLQQIIEDNVNLKTKIVDYFLTEMDKTLRDNFNLNLQKVATNILESDYQQDPRYITSTLINPRIIIINAASVKPKAVLDNKYYYDNNISCIIFVNAEKTTTMHDLTDSIPIFYLTSAILTINDNFLTLFINDKNETELYILQPTELIILSRNIITAQKFIPKYSQLLFNKILEGLKNLINRQQANIYEIIHNNQIENIFIYCYLIDILNNNEETFDNILKSMTINDFNNKINVLYQSEQILSNLNLKPNYFNKMHKTLIALMKQQAKLQKNIIKAYQVLTNNTLLSNKEVLNMLQELYDKNDVSLNQLLALINIADSSIIEKIWNQNLFAILDKFLFAINNNDLHRELFDAITTTTFKKNSTLLINLYSYAQEYIKYCKEMKKRETSGLQRHWQEIWDKVEIIKERCKNINNSNELIIQLLYSLSQLEIKYKAIKFKNMFNSESKFQEYFNLCSFDKAALYLMNLIEEKITPLLNTKHQFVQHINEKLFVLKDVFDKNKYKQIMQLYQELTLYLYCEKARNEHNDNKNRDALKKIKLKLEEVLI
ncbi:hypothetical protein SKUN_00105 [Spiroplasma kunkelii CR2-3x]|uniref:Uncharacterized protein n=1 Tax=Spiroplasma kunkelii CR2-3x TaxID=273035 RepID=A0A0K2JEM1_SPIKU|nr:hypothetical protein [Spiroplasma kunkelii]ALA97029.1 hypothetical protein SKUN_00105 [Spiroplasma kunkelii CR2-3x]